MTALQTRLAQPDVSSLGDAQAAAVLNAFGATAANGTILIDIPSQDIYTALIGTGEWGKLEWASRFAPTGTLASPSSQDLAVMAAISIVRAATQPQQGASLKVSDPAVSTAYAALSATLVSSGLIATNTRDVVLAGLAVRNRSWAAANGFPNGVTARDVGLARGGV